MKEKIRESKDLTILFDIIKTNQIEVAKSLNKLSRDLQKYVSALTFKVHDNKIYIEFDNDKMYKILLRKDILKKIAATKAHIDTLPGSFILEVGKPIVEEMAKVTDGETDLTQEAKGQSRNIGSKEAQRVQQN